MANELLDFVMSLVRDPDAAAAYAADPGQAIADAHLTDVTSVDVNNLIPVVAESMSSMSGAVPATGADTVLDDHAGNVWTSGAATAAFDAFDDHVPLAVTDDAHQMAGNVVTEPDPGAHAGLDTLADAGVPAVAGVDDPSLHFDGPVIDDSTVMDVHDTHVQDDWSHATPDDHHLSPDHTGLDIFDT